MVLVGRHSKCGICGELVSGEPIVGFPNFVRNRKDTLYMFTDAVFHRRCFLAHPLREAAETRLAERKRRMSQFMCSFCGQNNNDSGWYTTDHLTDDPASPLYEFNYIRLHCAHVLLWPRLAEFRQLIADFVSSGGYEGPPILPDLP